MNTNNCFKLLVLIKLHTFDEGNNTQLSKSGFDEQSVKFIDYCLWLTLLSFTLVICPFSLWLFDHSMYKSFFAQTVF